jgi:hypothetical protein
MDVLTLGRKMFREIFFQNYSDLRKVLTALEIQQNYNPVKLKYWL